MDKASHYVLKSFADDRPPPPSYRGLSLWMRENLFGSISQSILTIVGLLITYAILRTILDFAIFNATFSGADKSACLTPDGDSTHGACWPYIASYFPQFIYGTFPVDLRWRPNSVAIIGALGIAYMLSEEKYRTPVVGVTAFFSLLLAFVGDNGLWELPFLIAALVLMEGLVRSGRKNFIVLFMLTAFPVIALILLTGGAFDYRGYTILPGFGLAAGDARFWVQFVLLSAVFFALFVGTVSLAGRDVSGSARLVAIIAVTIGLILFVLSINFGLEPVSTSKWGGLLVTLVIASTGIVVSLPLGILLALGRRSSMPAVKLFSIIFIEFWRGIPLITVLFMADVMLPLFLPEGVNFDGLLRVLVGVTLFSAAYMAEVVRGGLQAIGRGQYEGAQSLGLNYGQMTRLIVLPQALKLVIPGIVNTFIGLFKDTTLVSIVGLFDLLGIAQLSYRDPTWGVPTQSHTGYLVVALLFFIFCFGMSRYSVYMERKLDTGHKR